MSDYPNWDASDAEIIRYAERWGMRRYPVAHCHLNRIGPDFPEVATIEWDAPGGPKVTRGFLPKPGVRA